MVVPAERRKVAFAGTAALVVGDGVVEIAAGGGPAAAGCGAAGGASPDQVLKFAAGLIARFLVTVIAHTVG
jgi:hypothetical protein